MRRTARGTRFALVAGALLAVALSTASRLPAASAPLYTLAATKRCLVAQGARVTSVRATDVRLKALRDVAQRNSIQVTSSKGTVGIAISRSPSDAALLAEVLQVPRDPYHVVLRRNALLMFRSASKRAFDAAAGCLRPR